jgi:hypothetical protein
MKKVIFYFSFLATFSFLSCQKDSSISDRGITQSNNGLFSESSVNVGTVLFEGPIVARRTDAAMLPAYRDLFTKNVNIEAIVLDSRNGYLGLTVMPPAHVVYATGYSCPQGSQNCNLENVAILDMGDIRDGGRGVMSWLSAVLGFRP